MASSMCNFIIWSQKKLLIKLLALTEKKTPQKVMKICKKKISGKPIVPAPPAHNQEKVLLYQSYPIIRVVGTVILVYNGLRGKGSHC